MTSTEAPERTAGSPPLRRQRGFSLLWFGESVSVLGNTTSAVLLPLLAVVSLDASAWWVGLLTAASWAPWLVIGLPAGAWVDRLPPIPVMVTSNLVSAAALGSIPLTWWFGAVTLPQLLVVGAVAGTCTVFFRAAYQSLLPRLVAAPDLVTANSRLQGSESGAQIGGTGVAGLLAQWVGAAVGLLLDAASFLVSSVCLLLIARGMPSAERPVAAPRRALRTEIAEGVSFVARDPFLRYFTWMGGLSNLGLTGYGTLLILFLVRDVGFSPAAIGGLLMITSTGALVGALLAGPLARRLGTARATVVVQLAAGSTALLIPLAGPGWRVSLFLVGQFMVALGVVAGNIIKGAFRQQYVPHGLMGRVVTSAQLVNFGTMPVAALLAGWLGSELGVRPTIAVMAAVHTLACAAVLLSPVRGLRDLPVSPPDRR
ncbi:MAG: MFS transporter [Geodermatophilaceae bacterium]